MSSKVRRNFFSDKKYLNTLSGLDFDGSNDYVQIYTNPLIGVVDFVLCIAIKVTNTANPSPIASTIVSGPPDKGFSLNVVSSTNLEFKVNDGAGSSQSIQIPYREGVWNFIAIDFQGGTEIRAYNGSYLVAQAATAIASVDFSGTDLTFGYAPNDSATIDYLSGELAHAYIFNDIISEGRKEYIDRYIGIISESVMESCILQLPFQYNTFFEDSAFRTSDTSATTAVNQVGHGFSVGQAIYDNGGTWEAANSSAEATYSDPPAIVVAVAGVDDFTYATEGEHTLVAHGFGDVGDTLYVTDDGNGNLTTEKLGNPLVKVIDVDTIQISSAITIFTEGTTKQYNFKKSTGVLDNEVYGEVFGKDTALFNPKEELFIRNTDLSTKFYGEKPFKVNGKKYNGSDSKDTFPATDIINETTPFSVLVYFRKDAFTGGLEYFITFGDVTAVNDNFIVFFIASSGALGVQLSSSGGSLRTFTDSTTLLTEGEEHSVVFTYPGNNVANDIKIYVDGVEAACTADRFSMTTTVPYNNGIVGIGGNPSNNSLTFNGVIRRLEVLERVLTNTEIADTAITNSIKGLAEPRKDYSLDIDFGKSGSDSLTTFPDTPNQYTITPVGTIAYEAIGDDYQDYTDIVDFTQIKNINGGGTTNQWIELDRSNLPNATDDFTFFVSHDPVIIENIGVDYFKAIMLLNDSFNPAGRTGAWMSIALYSLYSNVANYEARNVGGGSNFITDSGQSFFGKQHTGTINSICLVVKDDFLYLYVNSVLVASDFLDVRDDFSSVEYFMLGSSLKLQAEGGGIIHNNQKYYSCGYWKRALGLDEIKHLHSNGKPNNPWNYLPLNKRKMKDDLVLWHQFQGNVDIIGNSFDGSFSLSNPDTDQVKIVNWADNSGATDAEYVDRNLVSTTPTKTSGVYSSNITSTGGKGVFDIELFDVTTGTSLGKAVNVSYGADLSLASSWDGGVSEPTFSSGITLTASDIAAYFVAASTVGTNAVSTIGFDFQDFTVTGLPTGYDLVDHIEIRIDTYRDGGNALSDAIVMDETANDFITNWDTTLAAGDGITLPFESGLQVAVQVDWGDGSSVERFTTGLPTHTYSTGGSYTVRVLGSVESLRMPAITDKNKLTAVTKWGDLNLLQITQAFQDCINLSSLPAGAMTGVQNVTGLSEIFRNCPVTTFSSNFFENFVSITNLQATFQGCGIDPIPSGFFDYPAFEDVTQANSLFRLTSFASVPSGTFDRFINCSNFSLLLNGNTSLSSLPDSLFANCTSASNMSAICSGCTGLLTIGNNIFGASGIASITSLSEAFLQCTSLQAIPNDILKGLTSLTGLTRIFQSCTSATLTLTADFFDDCPNVTSTNGMFRFCSGFTSAMPTGFARGLTALTDANVMFDGCTGLSSVASDFIKDSTDIDFLIATFNGCTGISGAVPELWLEIYYTGGSVTGYNLTPTAYDAGGSTPVPDGNNCYASVTSTTSIPTYWQ